MSSTLETASDIRPYQIDIPDQALDDLRRRIAATNWPERETVTDRSQGVQLATIQELTPPARVAADHDPRLARLGHRAAGGRRPTDGPDRPWRTRRGRLHPGAAVAARLRLLRRADGGLLGPRPHRPRLGRADAAPRLWPLCRPGRGCGRRRHRRDGP